MLEALHAWTRKHGRLPTTYDWERQGKGRPTASRVWRTFRSWTDFLAAAGYEYKPPPSMRRWSKTQIKIALFEWRYEHDRLPTTTDWEKSTEDHPSRTTVIAKFGSWERFMKAAGYEHDYARQMREHWKRVNRKRKRVTSPARVC